MRIRHDEVDPGSPSAIPEHGDEDEARRQRLLCELREAAEQLPGQSARPERLPVAALLVGDGDLDEVEEQLRRMKVEAFRIRDADGRTAWRPPERLLVVSGRQALAIGRLQSRPGRTFTTIAISGESSKTLRAQLRRMEFDHLVQSPVHPEALELLLRSALHRAEERRGAPRFPFGGEVGWCAGWMQRRAIMPEISSRGCRLHVKRRVGQGGRIQVRIPAGVAGAQPLTLAGQVVRSQTRDRVRGAGSTALSVLFERLDASTRTALADLLAHLRAGPPPLARS